ncbi:MAG: hypothetical protein R6V75_01065 [Bacteroidales bacterium]
MKKIAYAVAGALVYLVLSLGLSSYDHLYTHKKLNVAIAEAFMERYQVAIDPNEKFYNYFFSLSIGALEGEEVSKGDMLDIKTATARKTPLGWIEHGGMSADEPQLPASFCHFYDPTQPEGQRYLKDLLDDFYVSWALENPKVDHVQWALSDKRNEYNYEAGKTHFKNALEQKDPDFRKMNMAFAWRALGQTLHLIADMGIASHVRDDAHPGVGAGAAGYKYSYDADPYEEIIYLHSQKNGIEDFLKGTVDPAVKSFSKSATTAKTIAEQLATYTNLNFFSHETISGTGVTPKIHPEKTYASPKLDHCSYDQGPAIYRKTIGGNNVLMCKDLSYLEIFNNFRGYPYIDQQCALSQATALMPQIREAGINVIRCFIPKLKVEITDIGDNYIEGVVSHTTDPEYTAEIKYNGLVEILSQKTQNVLYTIDAEDGTFRKEVDLSRVNLSEDKLFARIDCGGIGIISEPYEARPAANWKYVRFSFKRLDARVYHSRDIDPDNITISERELKWTFDDELREGTYSNGVFTAEWETDGGLRNKGQLTLHINERTQTITSGSFKSEVRSTYNPTKEYYELDFTIQDIGATYFSPSSATFGLGANDLCNPSRFLVSHYETIWTGYKNTLESYTCNSYSSFGLSLRESK